ncbi:hypothetical protein Tco_0848812 [Tanacetum coccineum]
MVDGMNVSTPFVSSVSTGGITNMSKVTAPHQSATKVTRVCNNNTINATKGLTQSPLVSPNTPLPLHQSNVDVAAIFGVLLTTIGDLEVLVKDIDAGKHKEFLSGMTNDKCKVFIDALGAMYELIETQSASNLPNDGFNSDDDYEFNDYEILIYTIDDVAALFDVPLNSLKEINEFTKDLKVGKNALWLKLTKEACSGIIDFICNSDPIVQFVDINTKSTSYARAAGSSAKDQPKVKSNFRPLVADPVLDGVNISIPHKVVKKVKLYDVPLQVFKEDGISLIAMFIGKPVMLDSYTSSMCNDSWRRSSFARCLIKCPKKVVSPPIVTTSNVVTPTVEKTNDGFQTVGKKRRGKVSTSAPKKRATNVSNASNSSSMLKTAGTSSKKDDITTSNSYSVLNNEEEDEEENVENVYDESENLFTNTKTGGSSFFMSVTG